MDHGDELFVAYQQTLQEHTNTSLKLKRIKNKGYLLEVTPKDIERFEASTDATKEEYDFVRIQSLK